jgi:hypothetical protein
MTGNAAELIEEFPIISGQVMTLIVGGRWYDTEAHSGICARMAFVPGNPPINANYYAGFRVAGPASIGVSP